jgi:four helix bundle protein
MNKLLWGMSNELKNRTKLFALSVIQLVRQIPFSELNFILAKQILRSATSTGANYRSALRGKSTADFIAKLSIAEEEADETCYWLELLIESNIYNNKEVEEILLEARQIAAILTASCKTAKSKIIMKGR